MRDLERLVGCPIHLRVMAMNHDLEAALHFTMLLCHRLL